MFLSFLGVAGRGQSSAPREAPAQKQLKQRELWFLRGRELPGNTAASWRYRAYRQKLVLRKAAAARIAASPRDIASPAWQSLGPAPLASDASSSGQQDYGWVSGRATAVAIDPADQSGNTVFLGGAYGGLWKSGNAGPASSDPANVIWQPLTDDQVSLSVGAIAIQPGNADPTRSVVLVGTGETNSSIDSYYGQGILRSTDGGVTWAPIIQQDIPGTHSFLGLGFSRIAFSTANTNLVVAATAGTSEGELEGLQNPVTANLGLYYSLDGGASWAYGVTQDGAAAVAPASATDVSYNAAAGKFFAALRFHGFYSSNDGIHWVRLPSQPGSGLTVAVCPPSTAAQGCPIYRGAIAVVPRRNGPNNLGEMYVWYVDSNSNDQGIWKSTNAGASWQPIDETDITQCGDLIGGCGAENGAYNLALAAVPDGSTATDLYAGAVNIFKCVISSQYPACSPAGNPAPPASATFRNLTHAYGCNPLGSIAHVHPAQHAMDFLVNNLGQALIYFANDGGIYRALDGYAGLTSGNCGTPNQFDNLSETLGSMTQFVSLAQHPTDANTLLGGAQGNGSPATAASQVTTNWAEVNGGDGGYAAINPDNPEEWFTANTGVSIQSCDFGIACHGPDFSNSLVVTSAALGGDGGPLYTPFLLDPQNAEELIVGTCRVWRGVADGSGFAPLSDNFETGSDATCTGAEINTIRSLAIGGQKDTNGFSNVIYAGTNGTGPLGDTPTGGQLWITTNAAAGPGTWTYRTGNINPGHFPISAIALDPADTTGSTAYATIMGFGVAHVWQTTNAGQTWNDFTANLPNAPANAALVDAGTVYVGTDVGVFASTTAVPSWTEVGPMPGSGQTGFLPDVPVTALALFNNGTTKLLRAATYGRGIWQFPLTTIPDFQIAVPNPTQVAFAGQTAQFSGAVSAFNGYGAAVTLSCVAGSTPPPSVCAFNPPTLTPGTAGTTFTLTAAAATGDYSFNVLAAGADGTTRALPLALHVVDFALSPPAPSAITIEPGQSSGPIQLQLSFQGSFPPNATVNLACLPLNGVSCSFSPSATLSPSNGNPANATLKVGTLSSMPVGEYSLTISASSSAAGSETVNQTLHLTVVIPGFRLTVSSGPAPTPAGATVMVNGTATASNGYSQSIQLSCLAASTPTPSTCSFNPASVVPSAAGTAFTLSMANPAAGSFSFNLKGAGSDGTTEQIPLALTVYDFSIVPDGNSQSVAAGQTAAYSLNFTPLPAGTTFQQNVTNFTCSGLPALSSCKFATAQISAGNGPIAVKLEISTTGPIAQIPGSRLFWAIWLPLVGSVLGYPRWKKRSRASICGVALALLLTALQPGCGSGLSGNGQGGNPQPGTPVGSYPITVTAVEGPLQQSAMVTLGVQ